MKQILFILLGGLLILSSCGEGDEKADKEKKESVELNCNETNSAIDITLAEAPDLNAADFKHVKAWRGGWQWSSGKHRLNVYVAFSNQEIEMSSYGGAQPSEDTTAYQIHVAFNGLMTNEDEDYVEVEKGTYGPGLNSTDEACAAVVIWNGTSGLNTFNGSHEMEGTAEITGLTDDHICGFIDFTSNGDHIHLTFNAPIEKDLFEGEY